MHSSLGRLHGGGSGGGGGGGGGLGSSILWHSLQWLSQPLAARVEYLKPARPVSHHRSRRPRSGSLLFVELSAVCLLSRSRLPAAHPAKCRSTADKRQYSMKNHI